MKAFVVPDDEGLKRLLEQLKAVTGLEIQAGAALVVDCEGDAVELVRKILEASGMEYQTLAGPVVGKREEPGKDTVGTSSAATGAGETRVAKKRGRRAGAAEKERAPADPGAVPFDGGPTSGGARRGGL
jgi:hypothetical protein